MKKALSVNNLNVSVGDFDLENISLEIPQGTIMGLVGRNGAGKTTFIESILNIMPKLRGDVLFNGIPLTGNEETVKAKIGIVFDSPLYPANMKAIKIKKMLAPLYPTFQDSKFDQLMERFELNPNKRLSNYSKGMQMKFSIAMAISHNPDLLILDEPTAGLDPAARSDVLDLLLDFMQEENKSVLFSTHITSDLEKIADYLTIIDQGKVLVSQAKDEILDQYALVQIPQDSMTTTTQGQLMGVKKTSLGYTALCKRENLPQIQDLKTARPSIEDLVVHFKEGA